MAENPRRRAQRSVARARREGNLGDLTGLKRTVSTATSRRQESERAQVAATPASKPHKRVPISSDQIAQDQRSLLARRGGYDPSGEWIEPNQAVWPKSYEDNYPPYDTFPKYNYNRERKESKLFSRRDEDQGDFIPLTYAPTKTSWPANGHDHRRTVAAGYSKSKGIIRVQFYTDGSIYDYGTTEQIPPGVAYNFRLTQSPGRFINSTLEAYGYQQIS